MEFDLILKDLSDTKSLARCIAQVLEPGDIILLSGDLGAGKTHLTKAICNELGISESKVTSPSFALIHHYHQGRIPVAHVDLYRLGLGTDPAEIGLDEYLDGDHIVIIEWSEYLRSGLSWATNALTIQLKWREKEHRAAKVDMIGEKWQARQKRLISCLKQAKLFCDPFPVNNVR